MRGYKQLAVQGILSRFRAAVCPSTSAGDDRCCKCSTCTCESHKKISPTPPKDWSPPPSPPPPPPGWPGYYYMSPQHSSGSMFSVPVQLEECCNQISKFLEACHDWVRRRAKLCIWSCKLKKQPSWWTTVELVSHPASCNRHMLTPQPTTFSLTAACHGGYCRVPRWLLPPFLQLP
jgi:hypothetical protein